MISTGTVLLLNFIAALIGVIAAWLKLRHVDKKRMASTGTLKLAAAADNMAGVAHTRRAPVMCSDEDEQVASLAEIEGQLHTGDVFLFSGTAIHSYLIRVPTWSRMSHCGMIYRDHQGRVWVAEVVEQLKLRRNGWRFWIYKGGFRKTPLADYVTKYPGQSYVAKVAKEYYDPAKHDEPQSFNRGVAASAILASVNWSYGWRGIGFQTLSKLPILRELVYLLTWRNIDKSWDKKYPPFCSWAVSVWATIAGQDPTPCLAPQLTTPAEIERSKLWGKKVALIP